MIPRLIGPVGGERGWGSGASGGHRVADLRGCNAGGIWRALGPGGLRGGRGDGGWVRAGGWAGEGLGKGWGEVATFNFAGEKK